MLHVILFILKLIGYLILGIIVLLALMLTAVLLSPFSYQARGKCDKEIKNLDVHGSFTYLFHLISGEINYKKEQFTWKIRIAWIRKSNIAETVDVKKEDVKKSDILQSDNDKILTAMEEKEVEKPIYKPKIVVSETKKEIVQEETTSKKNADIKSKKQKKLNLYERAVSKLRTLRCTVQKVCDKIKLLIQKKNILMAFITEETHVAAFKKLICELKKLLKKCCPKKVEGDICFGFEEPDLTGKVLAVLGMIYPLIGEHLNISPDFEKSVLDGRLFIKGKIRISSIVKMAWNLVWTKNVRTTIGDIRKFSFDEGGVQNG